MSTIHSGHDAPATSPCRCAWAHHFEDVTLWCTDDPIPGLPLCATHWIDWAHARADAGIPAGAAPTERPAP